MAKQDKKSWKCTGLLFSLAYVGEKKKCVWWVGNATGWEGAKNNFSERANGPLFIHNSNPAPLSKNLKFKIALLEFGQPASTLFFPSELMWAPLNAPVTDPT